MITASHKFLEYLEKEKNYSSYTIGNYRHYLGRFNTFKKITPQEITRPIIAEYREKLRNDGLSTKTINYHLIALRSLLQYLMREGIEAPHYRIIEVAKEPQRKIEYMTVEEVFKIMNTIHIASEIDLRDKAVIELLFATGLRVGELISLNRQDIDLDADHFSIIGKGRRLRIVFISARARYWLGRYLKRRADDFAPLFINYRGPQGKDASGEEKRLTAVSIQNIVRREARRAGINKKVTPHMFRHTFSTSLLERGADVRSIQLLLGHSHIDTTQLYLHASDSHLRKVHALLPDGEVREKLFYPYS